MRVGVVGVGHLGKEHARIFSELEGATLAGVVDTDRERGREVAGRHGTELLEDPLELVERVTAVSVAVPTPLHLEAARPFLEAGRAVLIEKPLAANLEEAEEILRIAKRSGSTLQVGHIERFNPVLAAALPHVHDPLFIECDRIHPFSLRSTDVSVVLDLMIHDIDLILQLIQDDLEEVDAVGASVISTTEDLATARLVFRGGASALVKTSRVAFSRSRKIRIFCHRAYLSLDLVNRSGTRIGVAEGYDPSSFLDDAGRISAPEGEAAFLARFLHTEQLVIPSYEPLRAELEAFLRAVREGTPALVTGAQGLRAMATARRIEERILHHRERVASRPHGGAGEHCPLEENPT